MGPSLVTIPIDTGYHWALNCREKPTRTQLETAVDNGDMDVNPFKLLQTQALLGLSSMTRQFIELMIEQPFALLYTCLHFLWQCRMANK